MAYAFGWVPSKPDIRDRIFRVPPQIDLTALPPVLDLSNPSPGTLFENYNQETLGSCGPNSLAENLIFDMYETSSPGPIRASRLFLYYNTRGLMGTISSDSGVDNRSMLKALQQYGWCTEDDWPYEVTQFAMKPPKACYEQASATVGSFIYESVPQDIPIMCGAIAAGNPIIFGFSVFQSMLKPQIALTGDVPMPMQTPFDAMAGGHDVLLVGYDLGAKKFKFKNHWVNPNGVPWGKDGYGTIDFAYAANPQLASDFWAVNKTGSPITPAPTPPPSPSPIPPPGSLQEQIDAIFAAIIEAVHNAALVVFIQWIQSLIDSYIAAHNMIVAAATPSALQQFVDDIFAAIQTSLKGKPMEVMALKMVQKMVDQWLKSHNMLPTPKTTTP